MNGTKLPHTVRMAAFLLRVATGAALLYLGFTTLFAPALGKEVRARSLGSLYAWLAPAGTAQGGFFTAMAWAFGIAGACLVVGFATRLAAAVGIAITAAAFIESGAAALNPAALANDEVLLVPILLVIFLTDAGSYLGLDTFVHIRFSSKRKK